jgi:hypothetical protein
VTDTSSPGQPRIERRGLEPAVLDFLRQLLDDYESAHQREHALAAAATNAAIEIAATRLEEAKLAVREHYDTLLSERDLRYNERFHESQESIKTALAAADKQVMAAFAAQEKALSEANAAREKALEAAMLAAEKAIIKSEVAQEKRADAVYVTLDKLQTALSNVMPRSEAENRFITITDIIGEVRRSLAVEMGSLRERVKEVESTRIGSDQVNDKIDAMSKAFEARIVTLQQQLSGIEAVTR